MSANYVLLRLEIKKLEHLNYVINNCDRGGKYVHSQTWK